MASELSAVFFGSVNRWECDENDHLNVRFFAHKMFQTLQAGLVEKGLLAPGALSAASWSIDSVHMRYIAEARIAAPMTGCFGVLAQSDTGCQVITELRNTANQSLMASFVYQLSLEASTHVPTVELPDGAGPRSIPARVSEYAALPLEQLENHGFTVIGRGVIQPEECDEAGNLLWHQYIGRISDSLPNLWARFNSGHDEGLLGGAVLEYRIDWTQALQLGSQFIVASGFKDLGDKTKHLVHLTYDVATGTCAAASEAVAITMDLEARKAVSIPDKQRELISRLLLKPC